MKRSSMHVSGIVILLILLPSCSGGPKPMPIEAAKGAFDELRSAVRNEVRDPAKAAEVVGLVDRLEQIMIEAGAARKVHAAAMRRLNANYDAAEEDFRALFSDFNRTQRNRQERLLVIDQRGRELTTEREWKALSTGVAHALDASARAELGL